MAIATGPVTRSVRASGALDSIEAAYGTNPPTGIRLTLAAK